MKFCLCLSLSLILYAAVPMFAQSDARYEASAGYSYLSIDRHGWVLSFTEKVGKRFGIEAEVGGNYRKDEFFGGQQPNFLHSILAGPQFKFRNEAKFVPWGHVLAGITLNNVTVPVIGGSTLALRPTTNVRFGFQPGGGTDYWFKSKLGIRVGGDYRLALGNFSDDNFFRLQSGVVVRFGSR
jgi:hypothetical protein